MSTPQTAEPEARGLSHGFSDFSHSLPGVQHTSLLANVFLLLCPIPARLPCFLPSLGGVCHCWSASPALLCSLPSSPWDYGRAGLWQTPFLISCCCNPAACASEPTVGGLGQEGLGSAQALSGSARGDCAAGFY